MKRNLFNYLIMAVLVVSIPVLQGCSSDDDSNGNEQTEVSDCTLQLFDGDNYTDDRITIKGPGEFADLSKLPGSNKDWNDEADSFKAGKNVTVTMWTKTNFQGDSITYKKGAHQPSVDEPSSLKIKCD